MGPLRVLACLTPAEFLDRAGAFLEAHEAEHNLILGIAGVLAARPESALLPPWLLTVEDAGRPVAAALMTPPHGLVLSRSDEPATTAPLDHLLAATAPLSGVNGPVETARALAAAWCRRTGGAVRPGMPQRIYETATVTAPANVSGRLRPAVPADADLAARWHVGFTADALHQEEGPAKARAAAERWIAEGALHFWRMVSRGPWRPGRGRPGPGSASRGCTPRPRSGGGGMPRRASPG